MTPSSTATVVPGCHALVVAHAFVPASPIGTMRTLRVVRALDAAGWSQTVLMASPTTYLNSVPQDPSLASRVPARTEIVHAPVWRPVDGLARALRSRGLVGATESGAVVRNPVAASESVSAIRSVLRSMTTFPDGEIGWFAPAVLKGLSAIRRNRSRVIYSTAPPWTGQLVACTLARLSRLPWVADFRDPWARAPWREQWSSISRQSAAVLEAHVIARANRVIFATEANHEEYAKHYGANAAQRFCVIPNGCDPDEFTGLRRTHPEHDVVIVHAGSIYGARTPEPLIRAIASAIRKGLVSRGTVRLRMIGVPEDARMRAIATELDVDDAVQFLPRMPRRQALEEMAAASVLLVLQPSTTVSIPAKLYEYLALGKPILALCAEGETARLVRGSGLGKAVTGNDPSAVESALIEMIAISRVRLPQPAAALYNGNLGAARIVEMLASVSGVTDVCVLEGHKSVPRPVSAEVPEWRV